MVSLPHFFELHPDAPGAQRYRVLVLQLRAFRMELATSKRTIDKREVSLAEHLEKIKILPDELRIEHEERLRQTHEDLIAAIELKMEIIRERVALVRKQIDDINRLEF